MFIDHPCKFLHKFKIITVDSNYILNLKIKYIPKKKLKETKFKLFAANIWAKRSIKHKNMIVKMQ
jgi:hypothetical protein